MLSENIPELFNDWRNQVDMPSHGLLGPVTWIPDEELEDYDFEYDEYSGEEIKSDPEPDEMDAAGVQDILKNIIKSKDQPSLGDFTSQQEVYYKGELQDKPSYGQSPPPPVKQ